MSSECFDAELEWAGMLSPSFYVVPHNKSGSTPAPRTTNLLPKRLLERSIFLNRDGDTHFFKSGELGLVLHSSQNVAASID